MTRDVVFSARQSGQSGQAAFLPIASLAGYRIQPYLLEFTFLYILSVKLRIGV